MVILNSSWSIEGVFALLDAVLVATWSLDFTLMASSGGAVAKKQRC